MLESIGGQETEFLLHKPGLTFLVCTSFRPGPSAVLEYQTFLSLSSIFRAFIVDHV